MREIILGGVVFTCVGVVGVIAGLRVVFYITRNGNIPLTTSRMIFLGTLGAVSSYGLCFIGGTVFIMGYALIRYCKQ